MGEKPRQEDEQPTQEMRGPNVEHLAEGFKPIVACVGTREEYGKELSKLDSIEEISHNVNYFKDPEYLKVQDFKSGGVRTYVISGIDERPKFTKKLYNCTTMMVVGGSKEDRKNISFLTHQDPNQFLSLKKEIFVRDLKEQLQKMKEKCIDGSIDIAIAGGNLSMYDLDNYRRSVELLDLIVKEVCGFEPLVICGPKQEFDSDNVYFDTENRRAYITRPERRDYQNDFHNEPFKASKVGEMIEKWKKVTELRRKEQEKKDMEEDKYFSKLWEKNQDKKMNNQLKK